MNIHVELLRDRDAVRSLLLKHGWRLGKAKGSHFSAKHPAVDDEEAARHRLNNLGLLTSSAVRIEFDPHVN